MTFLLSSRLQPLRSYRREVRLSFFPQSLTFSEVVQVILICAFRQLLHLIGFRRDIRINKSKDDGHLTLPEIRLSMPFRVTKDDLRRYAAAVGLSDPESILSNPTQSCLFLSAMSEPAMLLLLAMRGCPIRPLGTVNVKNKFEILDPERCSGETLLNMKGSELRARLLGEFRRVKRGLEVDLEVEIVNGDEDITIFRQTFTVLQFIKVARASLPTTKNTTTNSDEDKRHVTRAGSYEMQAEAPMAWAQICKDYNPLHTSTLAAKAFGFPGRIAHGNHALSLGIACLNSESEGWKMRAGRQNKGFVMEVQFRKPIVLPAKVTAQLSISEANLDISIIGKQNVLVSATMKMQQESGELDITE